MKNINLKFKFLISFVAIIFLLGLAILIFVNTTLTKKLYDELIKRGISISKDIAHGGLNFVLTENIEELQMFINDYKKQEEDVEYIFIINSNREILVHTFSDGFPVELKNVNILNENKISNVQPIKTEKGIILDIVIPLLENHTGEVHLGLSQKSIQQTLDNIIKLLISIILLTLAIGIALLVFLAKK